MQSTNIKPTPQSIQDTRDLVYSYPEGIVKIKTFEAVEAEPDLFTWAASDPGGWQFSALQDWASKVYVSYVPSASCGGTEGILPNSIPLWCELAANPDPEKVSRPVQWTANLYTLNQTDPYTWEKVPWAPTGPVTYTWAGSDGISQTTAANTIAHSYAEAGNHYLNLNVQAGIFCSLNCSENFPALGHALHSNIWSDLAYVGSERHLSNQHSRQVSSRYVLAVVLPAKLSQLF